MAKTLSWNELRVRNRSVDTIIHRVDNSTNTRWLDHGPGIAHMHAAYWDQVPVTIKSEGVIYELLITGTDRGAELKYAFRGFVRLVEGRTPATHGEVEGYFCRGMDNGKMMFITGPTSHFGQLEAMLDAHRREPINHGTEYHDQLQRLEHSVAVERKRIGLE